MCRLFFGVWGFVLFFAQFAQGQESFLVEGVAFEKTFSYAGFEQQPKSFNEPLVVLLNVELELKSEKENAEVRLADSESYQAIVDAVKPHDCKHFQQILHYSHCSAMHI